jgi:hypothetical protein
MAGNPGDDMSGLVDMFMLSKCTEIIPTLGSSFGFVAAAISKRPIWYVLPGDHITVFNPAFVRQTNSEPCMWMTRRWLRDSNPSLVSNYYKDGTWRQYTMCHPLGNALEEASR